MSSPLRILFTETFDSDGVFRSASEEVVLTAMNETAVFLESLGKKVVFISSPPRTGKNLTKCWSYNLIFEGEEVFDCDFIVADLSEQHTAVMKFLTRPDLALPVMDLSQYICNAGKCPTFVDGINIYRDHDHLSYQGSHLIGLKSSFLESAFKLADQAHDVTSSGSKVAGGGFAARPVPNSQ